MSFPQITSRHELARGWVKEAISFYRAFGEEISLAEFMNPRGRFVGNSCYVFVMDSDGIMLAHPINERFAGKSFIDVRDSEGNPFVREIVEKAECDGSGFADYKWYFPECRQERYKTTYYEKADGLIICSGFQSLKAEHPESSAVSKEDYPENFFELLDFLGM